MHYVDVLSEVLFDHRNLIVPLSRMMYNNQFSLNNDEKALKALIMDLLYIIVLFVK